jgi:hypothetical protein
MFYFARRVKRDWGLAIGRAMLCLPQHAVVGARPFSRCGERLPPWQPKLSILRERHAADP